MRIKNITETNSSIIELENEKFSYERYAPDCWNIIIGESSESIHDCTSLEEEYQRYIKTLPTTVNNTNFRTGDRVKRINGEVFDVYDGDIGIISGIHDNKIHIFGCDGYSFDVENFVLATPDEVNLGTIKFSYEMINDNYSSVSKVFAWLGFIPKQIVHDEYRCCVAYKGVSNKFYLNNKEWGITVSRDYQHDDYTFKLELR